MPCHLRGDPFRRRGCRLDRQRQLLIPAALLTQVGPHRFGEQGVAEPQPGAGPADQPGVQDGFLGSVTVGQRQRGELSRAKLAARRGEHLDEIARRTRQCPRRRANGGPQVPRRRVAARCECPGAFHRQQRVPIGNADHLLHRGLGQVRHAARHRRQLDHRQRSELEVGDLHAAAGQVGDQRVGGGAIRPVAPGQHEQHRPGGQAPADVRAQLHASRVGPVHVLGDQENRTARCGPLHQPQHRVENP
jgi:hypothetical protein